MLLCMLLLIGTILPLVFADVSFTIRFDEVGNYGMVAAGVGLKDATSGDVFIDVPGTVVAAYLYWAGIDVETGGDDSVVFDGVTLTADEAYGPESWFSDRFHFVYMEDVATLVNTGPYTYTVADVNLGYENYGAGLVVVYEDMSLPMVRIVLEDGLDGFWFGWGAPVGPNSEVVGFDFVGSATDRDVEMFLVAGGTEHDDRPNAIWTETGTGVKPTNLITSPTSVGGSYPLVGSDGSSWDTYGDSVMVPAGDEWLCVQVESIVTTSDSGPEDYYGRGTSALLIAAGFVLPVPCYEGLTPGFWKNHPCCWTDTGYATDDDFNTLFGVSITINGNSNPTLMQALNAKGGVNEGKGVYGALARHAVAALLNAAHPEITYPMTEQEIIDAVHDAIINGGAESLKNTLDMYNNAGGGIDAHCNPI